MASSTIRKAIGAVKDQTSISIAKVAGNLAPDLEVLVVKATAHDEDPAGEKYLREIADKTLSSRGHSSALAAAVARRLSRTRDWIVALKCLVLVHRVFAEGHWSFMEELLIAQRGGVRVLNLSGFRDEAHSNSWDHSSFVRLYAMYLEEKSSKNRGHGGEEGEFDYGTPRRSTTPMGEMRPELVLEKLTNLLRILDRILACRPAGEAKNSRLVAVALYRILKDSFGVYGEVCEALKVLLDRFKEMEYGNCVKAFHIYGGAKKMVDELAGFHAWCRDKAVARSSEFPEIQTVSDETLVTLEEFLKEMANGPRSDERNREEMGQAQDMNEVKALPPPENHTPPPPLLPGEADTTNTPLQAQKVTEDLLDLSDNGVSADEQGNKLALALFSEPPRTSTAHTNGSWEAFPPENAGWEVALVESAASLSRQKADLGGGFDPLVLDGLYDHGQRAGAGQAGSGSASSVALPGVGPGRAAEAAVGPGDPFEASLAVPPPGYVQMAEMERKRRLLAEEWRVWEEYGRQGMQGQVGLAEGGYGNPSQTMPYGMPGYYYPNPPY